MSFRILSISTISSSPDTGEAGIGAGFEAEAAAGVGTGEGAVETEPPEAAERWAMCSRMSRLVTLPSLPVPAMPSS